MVYVVISQRDGGIDWVNVYRTYLLGMWHAVDDVATIEPCECGTTLQVCDEFVCQHCGSANMYVGIFQTIAKEGSITFGPNEDTVSIHNVDIQ